MKREIPRCMSVGSCLFTNPSARSVTARHAESSCFIAFLQEIPELEERLPETVRTHLRFPSRTEAMREAHFPSMGTPIRILNDFRSAAQCRLIFEEFFWLECGLEIKRQKAQAMPGIGFALGDNVREQIKNCFRSSPPECTEARTERNRGRYVAAPVR